MYRLRNCQEPLSELGDRGCRFWKYLDILIKDEGSSAFFSIVLILSTLFLLNT